jgi:hypothetical protein
MIDQRLPLITIHQWDRRHKAKETIHKTKDNITFEEVKDLSKYSKNNQSFKDIMNQLENQGVTIRSTTNSEPKKVITWKKGSLLYPMNDEIVSYSLARRIRYEVTNDLILDLEKIRIELQENGEDLNFLIKNPLI